MDNVNYTIGALVVDRSGSMWNIAEDVKGSVKQFINDQKNQNNGKMRLTVAQFDHTYEVIHNLKDVQEIDADEFASAYTPRGSTALLDAIGRSILDMQKNIETMTEKPNRVVIAILTDGEENSSREFKLERIKEMIKEKETIQEKQAATEETEITEKNIQENNPQIVWDFLFLATTLDTIKVAEGMGFSKSKTAIYEASNIQSGINTLNSKFAQARMNEKLDFTQEERDEMARPASVPAA